MNKWQHLGATALRLCPHTMYPRLSLEVMLLWAHRIGISYLSPLRDLLPISSDQFCKHLKTSLFVSENTDSGRERLWLSGV